MRNNLVQRKRSNRRSLLRRTRLHGDRDNIVILRAGGPHRQLALADQSRGDYYVSHSPPDLVNAVVVAGSTCQVAPHAAMSPATMPRPARTVAHTRIPRPGRPADETWAGFPRGETRNRNPLMTGVCWQLTYDPELDLVFYDRALSAPPLRPSATCRCATMDRHQHPFCGETEDRLSGLAPPGAPRALGPRNAPSR